MLTKSSDPHHAIGKKPSLRPKTGLRIKTKTPQDFSFKDLPETQSPTITNMISTSKPSSPRSILSPPCKRVTSPLVAKSKLFFKRSLSPKEVPGAEKHVLRFKAVPKKQQECGSSSPSEEGRRMIDLRSNRKQVQINTFTQEVEKVEQIRQIKEPQIPLIVFASNGGSKRGSINEAEPLSAYKLMTEGEKLEEVPPHMTQSSGIDFSTGSFLRSRQKSASMVIRGGIPKRFGSPTTQEWKLATSNQKTQVVEDNHLLFTEDTEIDSRGAVNEKELRKIDRPVSQAMFRMRELKKAKEIVLKKNKRKLSITTETTNTNSFASKLPSPRPIESPFAKTRPFFSPQGKTQIKIKFPEEPETMNNIDLKNSNFKEFERNRAETMHNFLSTEKTMTTLPDEGLTIRVTKSIENKIPAHGQLPQQPEDENQSNTMHFMAKSKTAANSKPFLKDFRRKSDLGLSKVEKYSMKRFLKLNEGSNNSYNTLNSIESPTLPKIPEIHRDPKSVKEICTFRQQSIDQEISLANSEEKVRRTNPKSLTVNLSPTRKSIFKPATISTNQPCQQQQPQPSPKFSPLLKHLESPVLRNSKPGIRNENNVIRRKKSGNPLEEIDELSQISIKQFEVNDSFDLDNFELLRKTSIKLNKAH